METSSIRMNDGRGTLWPDSFTEDAQRLDTLPDSVPALLVLWNRYHNVRCQSWAPIFRLIQDIPQYVAKQLLSYNEEGQWKDPAHLTTQECSKQDNEIFHVARSITCIHFMNAVREDFLKGLVGMPIAGPSAQVDILFVKSGLSLTCAYNDTRDRMSEIWQMTKQAALPLWSPIFCTV